jgi:4-amino-4-deoxy-L-arabinose transferase-like glycosyltransferase
MTAALLAALYVPSVYDATVFASENLFAPLIALVALLVLRHLRTGSLLAIVGAGLSLGWAILTRPFAILLLPIFVAILVYRRWRAPSSLLLATCSLVLSASIVVVPWTVRNYRVFHRVVLVATNGGSTFYGGNNDTVLREPYYYGGWVSTVGLPGRKLIEAAPDEVTHDKKEWDLGLQWVRANVAWIPLLDAMKVARFCLPEVSSGNKKYVWLQILGTGPFLLLMFFGLGLCARDREYWTAPWMLIHAIMLASVFTALVFWGSPRFRDANAPLLMLYAAVGLHAIVGKVSRR